MSHDPPLGESAAWFVLAATILAVFVRAIDVESWALLMPGGFVGRVTGAFGPRAAACAAAAAFVERLLLGALACLVVGHYLAGVAVTAIAGWRFTGYVRSEDIASLLAAGAIGLLWIRSRTGRGIGSDTVPRGVWLGVGILALTMVWGMVTLARNSAGFTALASLPPPLVFTDRSFLDAALAYLVGFALTLPVVGGGDVLDARCQ